MRFLPIISLFVWVFTACRHSNPQFELLSPKQSGVTFINEITESDSLNIMQHEFMYNGGGVGIADLNGDGLQDLYFTGNQVPNRLYLNRGNMQFEDVTEVSGAQKKPGQWSSGINIVDINCDGRPDIYVCNTFKAQAALRANLLFVHQGNNANGVPVFQEMAAEYGIADSTHSSNAQFFDYDNDGDLDLFISVNEMDSKFPNKYIEKSTDGSSPNCDRLYRNDKGPNGHPFFTEVSKAAGLLLAGFSHSAIIHDFNEDGWQDIYVANDYVSNDLLYINQRNGTFSNQIAQIFKHQAASAMGSDLADVNNDGHLDLFTTEMLPYYNKRKKLFIGQNNYATYVNNRQYGYEHQYGRNVLQLNQGIDTETGLPVFSDVAFMTGLQETEWSWAPLLADFNNDGFRDLYVTNGFPRDVTDHDFTAFHSGVRYILSPLDLQEKIPQVKTSNFLFFNKGDLAFEDVSSDAGLDIPSFSNGAAYADLDNDGDLDLVVNNIDDPAFVIKNTLNDRAEKPNFLRIQLNGPASNPDAIGAEVTAYFGGIAQKARLLSARGYISCPEKALHFGVGNAVGMDSLCIRWNHTEQSVLKNIPINQVLKLSYNDVDKIPAASTTKRKTPFTALAPATTGLDFVSNDYDFVDFNHQWTLPHKFSQYGPGLSVGDLNGDGLDDLFIGGSSQNDASFFVQDAKGRFSKKTASFKTEERKLEEDMGSLFFDADGDGDQDLYIVRGGAHRSDDWEYYQDVLVLNDGQGNFTPAPNALPKETISGQSVKAADFDGDGDLDLFVAGRVLPMKYPKPAQSVILRNDSQPGASPVFTDVTAQVCPELQQAGLISDALWTDFNNDFLPDLVIAGEWMPLTFFQNKGGKFVNVTQQTGIGDKMGWWTSLAAADFDNDGDTDYIAGNFGQNTYFKCTEAAPVRVYAKDFDGNGAWDPFITCYWIDSLHKPHEYIYHTRDDVMKQMPSLRKRFNTYGQFGEATLSDVFSEKDLEGAQKLSANYMSSSYVENLGNGRFQITTLPTAAQIAPVYGMLPFDLDNDGWMDLLLIGNDYGMELLQGRADAFYGLVLKNQAKGAFRPLGAPESGFMVPGDGRALTRLVAGGKEMILASQNEGPLKAFATPFFGAHLQKAPEQAVAALLELDDNTRQYRELYRGNGFLAQESRTLSLPKRLKSLTFYNHKGQVIEPMNGLQ